MKIELLKPHTHAGRDYPEGSLIDTEALQMDRDSAEWLIAIGAARRIEQPNPQGE